MKPERKRRLQGTTGEQVPNVLIKQEVEWLAEDSHALDLANQEEELEMESILSIKTEEISCHTDAVANAVQEFTPVPQTDEFIKTELILDEELTYNTNDSKSNCKQNVLAQADELDSNSGSSTQTNNQHIPPLAHRLSVKESETGEIYSQGNSRQSRGTFVCELCQRTCRDKYDLRNHLSTHATDRKREVTCDLCEKKFYHKLSLKTHKKLHCPKLRVSTFNCNVCGARYTQKENLKVHIVMKHLDQLQQQVTLGAQTAADHRVTSGPETAADHSINTNLIPKECSTEKARIECEICSRSLKDERCLKLHLRTHSKDRKRDFACDLCGKTFYNKRHLWYHKKVHAPYEYHCNVCGKSYKHEKSLKLHILRSQHFDETQQFSAEPSNEAGVPMKSELLSDEEFIDENNDRDLVPHAEGNKQPAPAADNEQHARVPNSEVCDSSFTERANLNIDLLKKSLDKFQPEGERFECEICSRFFKTKRNLSEHLSTHSKYRKRDFSCDLCGKTFYQERSLLYHKRIHYRDMYRCKVCRKCYKHEKTFNLHILRSQHFDQTPQFTAEPSNDAMESELLSDEEFIDEGNDRNLPSHTEESQQPALTADYEQHASATNSKMCESSFPEKANLWIHTLLAKSLDDSQPIIPAPQMAADRSINTNQMLKNSQTEGDGFKCEICSRSLKTKKLFRLHLNTHSKDRTRDFACDSCEKKFYNKRTLWTHNKIHTGEVCHKKKDIFKIQILLQNFEEPQQLTSEPSNDADVRMKTEQISDEEFIDEGNDEIQSLMPKEVNN